MFCTSTDPSDETPLVADDLSSGSASGHESDLCSEPARWEAAELDEFTIGLMAFELQDYATVASALLCVPDGDRVDFALAQEWLVATRLKAGRPELAIQSLRRAVQLNEQMGCHRMTIAQCQFALGLAYACTGHDECALSEFRAALRHEPSCGSLLLEIARVHAHRNRITESVAALAEAARQDEYFLVRALSDCDFETVRQAPGFQRVAMSQLLSEKQERTLSYKGMCHPQPDQSSPDGQSLIQDLYCESA